MNTEIYNINSNLIKNPIRLNTSFSLPWIPVAMLGYFLSIQWSGGSVAPAGKFYLECAGEPYLKGTDIQPPNGFPFFMREQLQNPSVPFIIGDSDYDITAVGKNAWNVSNAEYSFVRLSYSDTGGGLSDAQLVFGNLNQKG